MVNRSLSNPGIRLDNFGAKLLKTKEHKMRMVGPAGLEPAAKRLWLDAQSRNRSASGK